MVDALKGVFRGFDIATAGLRAELARSEVVACVIFVRASDGSLVLGPNSSKQTSVDFGLLSSWLADVCQQALGEGVEQVSYAANKDLDAICVPVRDEGTGVFVTLVKHTSEQHRRAIEMAVAQLVAMQLDRRGVKDASQGRAPQHRGP